MSSTRKMLLRSLLLLTLIISAGCAKTLSEHTKDEEPESYGSWEVGHSTFTLIDSDRNDRALKVDVWYPVDDDDIGIGYLSSYPLLGSLGIASDIAMKNKPVSSVVNRKLIIFSHGYGAPNTQSTPLMENLASHGFIVVSPAHTGNTVDSSGDTFEVAGANRVPDVSFVIDAMFERNNDSQNAFYGRIDETEVGVVGHSFGGMTSLGAAAGLT